MSKPPIPTTYPIYFTDELHRENFAKLQARYPHNDFSKNGEYRSVCYIAALPDIFKCFDLSKQVHGPFEWLWEYFADPDEYVERGETSGSTAPLTSGTWALCEIALSLWNGRECDLAKISGLDPALYLVVLQAMDLRRRAQSFDYSMFGVANLDGWYDVIVRKQEGKV